MKTLLLLLICSAFSLAAKAQKIDSIYFNLYTDSLKKGALHFNYINVDGRLADGSYIPLDTTHVRFTASGGQMKGNVLRLDSAFKADYVIITATLISNPSVTKQVRIYIKRVQTEEPLKSAEELIDGWQKEGRRKNQR